MYWLPKTRIGKVSFYVTVGPFVLLHAQFWISMLFRPEFDTLRWYVVPGFASVIIMIAGSVCSAIAMFKHKDRAYMLILPMLIGVFWLLFIIGEFAFPH